MQAAAWRQMLTAVAADRQASERASRYVAAWRPCYESEGFHDCPKRDAEIADGYRVSVSSPLREFLTLLAAHRWLCAAEAYTFEENLAFAADARRTFRARVSEAVKARSPMLRRAASRLRDRATCFPPQ